MPSPGAAAVYAPAISAQLEQERARGAALDSAAQSMVRSTGTMLSLFTALIALLGGRLLQLGGVSIALVAAGYALLIAAGIVAAIVGIPGTGLASFGEVSTKIIDRWLEDWSSSDADGAVRGLAELQLSSLKGLRELHHKKRLLSQMAGAGELAGWVALVLAIATVAIGRA